MIVLLGLFGVLAFLPRWQRLRTHHFVIGGILLVGVVSFYFALFKSLKHANDRLLPRLMNIEEQGPR